MRYRLFESDADDCDWGKSPVQWGIDIWPQRVDDFVNISIYDELCNEGIYCVGSLIYFDTVEDRTGFIFRWLL